MFFPIILIWLALVKASASVEATALIVEDGLYSRLTVQITEAVPRQLCHRALNNLQTLLTSTSRQLFETTNGLGRFKEISVVLPKAWAGTECMSGRNVTSDMSGFGKPDFRVTGAHQLFGTQPLALQYGQCGVPGLEVQLPFEILTNSQNMSKKSEILTFREWSRYRYGVFSETGFSGDRFYPLTYDFGGQEKTNAGCTGNSSEVVVLPANFDLDETRTQASTFDIAADDNNAIDGDHLLFVEEHDDDDEGMIQAFCSDLAADYNRDAPTKQNVLCQRKSSKEMILAHQDFARQQSVEQKQNTSQELRQEKAEFVEPIFNFVLETTKRFVLVLDVSQAMNVDKRWEVTRNALFRFLSHLPEGSQIAIVTFGSRARINVEPTVVTDDKREGLFGRIPFQLLNDEEGCIECGLQLGADLLLQTGDRGSVPEGSLILVTATEKVTSKDSIDKVRKYLVEDKSISVFNVAFSELCADVTDLAIHGANYYVPQTSVANLQQTVSDIFLNILSSDRHIEKSYEEYFLWNSNGTSSQIGGTFVVEEDLRTNLWIILTSPMKDVELFEVTSPSGEKYVLPKVENGIIYFHWKGSANEIGIWSYRVKLYETVVAGSAISVEVFGESNEHGSIQIEGWTNVGPQGADSTEDQVILYASVKRGDLPVLSGEVVATIQRPGSSTPVEVILRDDGNGYPDITRGDGIYSAYFTEFTSQVGLYSMTLRAANNAGQASVPKAIENSDMECCGSNTGTDNMYTVPTGPFTRHITAPSFLVTKGVQYFVKNGQPQAQDVFPPSRITDFAVMSYVNQTLYATLTWSAPGGDFDKDKAARYEMRCYTNAEALTGKNFQTMAIPVHESLLPVPAEYGTEQTATVGLPWANEVFYYGIVAFDEFGNRGLISNLIPVFAAEATTPHSSESDYDDNSQGSGGNNALTSAVMEAFGNNDMLTYIVAGAVSGLFLILLIIVVIAVCRCRRKVLEKKKQNERTQIFVNDIESTIHPNGGLPDIAPEKIVDNGITYADVWKTGNTTHLPNHTPTSDDYNHLANDYMMYNGVQHSSEQASWAYMSTQQQSGMPPHQQVYHPQQLLPTVAPVHDFRPYTEEQILAGVTPTYQNWTKPPSDNGTATTSSTECSNYEESSDNSENNNNKRHGFALRVQPRDDHVRRYSEDGGLSMTSPSSYQGTAADPSTLSLSPSFCSEWSKEKKRRQESLV